MTELKTIRKIPVGAVALMGATIEAVISFIYSVITAIFILVGAANLNSLLPAGVNVGSGAALAITVIIFATVGGFIGGYIVTAIVALV